MPSIRWQIEAPSERRATVCSSFSRVSSARRRSLSSGYNGLSKFPSFVAYYVGLGAQLTTDARVPVGSREGLRRQERSSLSVLLLRALLWAPISMPGVIVKRF